MARSMRKSVASTYEVSMKMERWAFIGVVPILAALVSWRLLRHDRRGDVLAVLGIGAIIWLGTLMGFGVWDHAALKGHYLVLRTWRDGQSVQV